MAINPPKRQAPEPKKSVIQWLLDSELFNPLAGNAGPDWCACG